MTMTTESFTRACEGVTVSRSRKLKHFRDLDRLAFDHLAETDGVFFDPMCFKMRYDSGEHPSGSQMVLMRSEMGLEDHVHIILADEIEANVRSIGVGLGRAGIGNFSAHFREFPGSMRNLIDYVNSNGTKAVHTSIDPNAPSCVSLAATNALFTIGCEMTLRFSIPTGMLYIGEGMSRMVKTFFGRDEISKYKGKERYAAIIYEVFRHYGTFFPNVAIEWTGHFPARTKAMFDTFVISTNSDFASECMSKAAFHNDSFLEFMGKDID